MMTMPSWLARPVRRFLATSMMVAAGHAGVYRAVQARPELPPASVDRVEVSTMDGTHVITHRATIDRILAIVRSYRGEWSRFPDTVCLLGTPGATFYEGAARRGSIRWGARAIIMRDRRATATRMLSPRDGVKLQALLER